MEPSFEIWHLSVHMYIDVITDDLKITFIIGIARADVWMNVFIEDVHRRLKGEIYEVEEPNLIKKRHKKRLPVEAESVKGKCISSLSLVP